MAEGEVAERFGIPGLVARTERNGGHAFVFRAEPGVLVEPDRVQVAGLTARPGETAYVLARRGDGAWQYLGVGRPGEERGVWEIPAV